MLSAPIPTTRPPWELFREFLDQTQDDLRCSRNKSIFKLPHKSRLDAFCSPGILITGPISSGNVRVVDEIRLLMKSIIVGPNIIFCSFSFHSQSRCFLSNTKNLLCKVSIVLSCTLSSQAQLSLSRSDWQNLQTQIQTLAGQPVRICPRIAAAARISPCDKLLSPCRPAAGSCHAADPSCRHMQLSADQTGSQPLLQG